MDLTTMTDEELDFLRRNVLVEQERRQSVANIPGQIADLREQYLSGGGDPALLTVPAE